MLHRPVATRRTALGGVALVALTGLTAGGCDLDPRSAPTPQEPAPPADEDGPVVDRVVAELREVAAVVAAARATHPSVRRALRPLADLHAAHLAVLSPDDPVDQGAGPSTSATSPPGASGEALRRVRAREERAQQRLAGASVAAASGDLARVLASMAAGTAQQVALLPATPPEATR